MISCQLITYLIFTVNFGYALNDVCNGKRNETECEKNAHDRVVFCSGNLPNAGDLKQIGSLILCDWPEEIFQPTFSLQYFFNLWHFSLVKSPVRQLTDFNWYPKLKELNISYNGIEYLRPTVFLKLTSLLLLDLRYNKLHKFEPSLVVGLKELNIVYLLGNQWNCSRDFLWIALKNNSVQSIIKDSDLLICNYGYLYKNKPLKPIMTMLKTLDSECAEISNWCNCSLDHVVRFEKTLRPMITVNCSYQHLKLLPHTLPNFTSTLIANGNEISNLDPFTYNEKYLNLLNVYLDYNNISSINILEASSWLLTFRALSLRGNKLSEVPVYALEHIFEKNHNVGKLVLSENPWKCNCIFTPHFKDFIAKYRTVMEDAENIRCAQRDEDENSRVSILSLSRNKICHKNLVSQISGFTILNICMVILLLLMYCHFIYNYFMYKKHGKLPWIANKIP